MMDCHLVLQNQLLWRIELLPRVLHVRDRFELDIGELAVLHFCSAQIDVQDDVPRGRIDRDRTARAISGLPIRQELDRLVASELAFGRLDQVEDRRHPIPAVRWTENSG